MNILLSFVRVIMLIVLPLSLDKIFGGRCNNVIALSKESSNAMKGICSILVMLGHSISALADDNLRWLNIGWYCVAIFFFWSGYGIALGVKKEGYLKTFWSKRLPKILIPFFTAHIFYILVGLLLGNSYTINDLVASILGQCTIVRNSWYPIALLVFYFVFWISFKYFRKKLLITALLIMGVTAIEYVVFSPTQDWWYISNFAFVIGVFFANINLNRINWKWMMVIGIALYCFGIILIAGWNRLFGLNGIVYMISCNAESAAVAIVTIFIADYFGFHGLVSKFLGEISYEIYLLHGLIIELCVETRMVQGTIQCIFAIIAMTILISYFVHKMNWLVLKLSLNLRKKIGCE